MGGMRVSPRYRPVAAGQSGARRFTDRREAFAAFSKALKDQPRDGQRVLNYYGIGGIGKSRLQHELRDMVARDGLGISLRLDFQAPAMRRQDAGLYQLRHCLRSEHGLELPLFDIAYAVYWQRANPKTPLSSSELPLLGESEILGEIVAAAGDAPVVGAVVSLIRGLDMLGRKARRWSRVREDLDLQHLDKLEMHEVLDALTFFFARDLLHTVDSHGQRCVVLLDAYEALWEDVTARGGRGDRDAWLRDLVAQTPGVFWVISSRDEVKWDAHHPEWAAPYLQRHAIGDLSPEDRLEFLQSCGVRGAVADAIAEASSGVPFYLDVSVDHWESLREERQPVPADFGRTQEDLLNRFIGHVPQAEEELLKVLSIPRSWDRELFEVLIRRFNISFPLSRWAAFCTYSFTRQTSGSRWVMHALMREELRRHIGAETALEVHGAILEHQMARAEDEALRVSQRMDAFRESVFHGLAAARLAPDWFFDRANFFMRRGLWKAMSEVVDEVELSVTKQGDSSGGVIAALCDFVDAWVLQQRGCLSEATAAYEQLHWEHLRPFSVGIRFQMANVLRETGRTQAAGSVYESLWSADIEGTTAELMSLIGIQYADFHYVQGRFVQSKAILDEIAALDRAAAPKEVAEAKRILGHIDRLTEEKGRGLAHYEQARELFALCEDDLGVAMISTNLAEAQWPLEPEVALAHAHEAIALNERLGARLEVGKARTASALAHLALGHHELGLLDARAAILLHLDIGYRGGEAQARLAEALALAVGGEVEAAAESALEAGATFEALEGYPTLRVMAASVVDRWGDRDAGVRAKGMRERALASIDWLGDPTEGQGRLERTLNRLLGD